MNYVDTSRDQAAGAIFLSNTVRVNWFEVFEGGIPIIENGKLLNGSFGRKMTCKTCSTLDVSNQVADTLYLPIHDQETGLPQATGIIFGAMARKEGDFEKRRDVVIRHRDKFTEDLPNVLPGGRQFKIPDETHGSTTKFRLLCVVFDKETGKLYAVSKKSKAKLEFHKWVDKNICDVLSASPEEVEKMKNFVSTPGGLLDQLRNPRNGDPGYRPWGDLLEHFGGKPGYKQAVKHWRCAMLMRQMENISNYEKKWAKIRQTEEILEKVVKLACDDGRESGDIKVLAAVLTRKEFLSIILDKKGGNGVAMEKLIASPHYICGMLTALYKIHRSFRRLDHRLEDERTNSEYEFGRKKDFFNYLVNEVRKRKGPVSDNLILMDYLPTPVQAEYKKLRDAGWPAPAHGAPTNHDKELADLVHTLFVANNERMRSVLRRGLKTGLIEIGDEEQRLLMPAARAVHDRIDKYIEGEKAFTDKQIISFVIEEVARNTVKNYSNWLREDPEKGIDMISWLSNDVNGQFTLIPRAPKSAEEMRDLSRQDYILTKMFRDDELALLKATNEFSKIMDKIAIDMPN
jgi:hypothetical protein